MINAKLKRQNEKLLGLIRVAILSQDRSALRNAQRQYLNSFSSKMVAAEEAKKSKKIKTHLSVREIAEQTDVWGSCDEKAWVHVKLKPNFDPRFYLSFGALHQSRQILLRNALLAKERVSDNQMLFRNGVTRAIKAVVANYENGYKHTLEIDIKNCYDSFQLPGVAQQLCLPGTVVDHVLGGTSLQVVPSPDVLKEWLNHDPSDQRTPLEKFECVFGDEWVQARQGMIQGSKASPFAVEVLLQPICRDFTGRKDVIIIVYADNFLVMARMKEALRKATLELEEALYAHPAGPLLVHSEEGARDVQSSFDFLGYTLSPYRDTLIASCSAKNSRKMSKCRRAGHRVLRSDMPDERKRIEIEKLVNEHHSIIKSFSLWAGAAEFHQKKMHQFLEYLYEARS